MCLPFLMRKKRNQTFFAFYDRHRSSPTVLLSRWQSAFLRFIPPRQARRVAALRRGLPLPHPDLIHAPPGLLRGELQFEVQRFRKTKRIVLLYVLPRFALSPRERILPRALRALSLPSQISTLLLRFLNPSVQLANLTDLSQNNLNQRVWILAQTVKHFLKTRALVGAIS